jgi:hypothetical protein
VIPLPPEQSPPDPATLAKSHARAIIAANPIDALCDRVFMPADLKDELVERWNQVTEIQSDGTIEIALDGHQSVHGFAQPTAVWTGSEAHVGVMLWVESEDDDADEDAPRVVFEDEGDKDFWTRVWTEFEPIRQLTAEPRVLPNKPCPCGSGRKAKRCCY